MRTCGRCVLDDSRDLTMTFDEEGNCCYCTDALKRKDQVYFPGPEGERRLEALVSSVKAEGKGRKYDCLMGISGGLDSSYLAYVGHKLGLRILAVHVDDGFDTPEAKKNISRVCSSCDIDLVTICPDPLQYNDIVKAFFRAEVPNVAIPQDNILFAELYRYAKAEKLRTFLSGGNFALESILQRVGNGESGVNAFCLEHIRDIHEKFGTCPMDKLHLMDNFQRIRDRYVSGLRTVRPLNLMDYNRNRAISELGQFCGFEYYEAKHCENILTKVIQLYWLPKKFGYDKRRSHLSSMIISGQMTRREALLELEKPACDIRRMQEDIDFLLDRLGMPRAEFDALVSRPGKEHSFYRTSFSYRLADKLLHDVFVKIKG